MTRFLTVILALLVSSVNCLHAASRALIVTGLSGSAANAEEFQRLAGETKDLLVRRGVPAERVEVLGGRVTRDEVLQKLRAAAAASPDDEFWLVLYGSGGRAQGDVPAFQVAGPRLTAPALRAALDEIPARQFVFVGTSDSGAFLPALKAARRAVLAATRADGETDWPRFPGAWVRAFAENPSAPFEQIAARAAALVEEEYRHSALAQTEHARLADPVSGDIREAPFGVGPAAADGPAPAAAGEPSLLSAADIKVTIHNPDVTWERQPANDETRGIIAAARATPNPAGHAALVLEQRLGFTVEEDRTTDRFTYWRVFLARDEAAEEWANQLLPQSPPMVTSKLEVARVIQPDGAVTVFNPARLPDVVDPNSGESCGMNMVFLPGAHAGCVVEVGFRTRALLNASLPHVSETLPLQRGVPALKTALEIRVPEKPPFRVALRNIAAQAVESSEHGRHVYRWQIGELPAAEAFPGDPPWPLWQGYAVISSLPSWEEFATWYRRLAKGSDAVDDAVKKMAAELGGGAKSRLEKIQRDFEFVSALRYVAIELGVQGFRPRTPAQVLTNRYGDCKDKANLLVALLRCQGIPADFVLLNRGAATDVSFPSWQFNHAIAYVPQAPESGQPGELWLDSTDSVTPFGFVPPGDYGRAALVFSPDKAQFQTVAGDSAAVSEVHDEWTLAQDGAGSWRGAFHRAATGLADDGLRRIFRGLTPGQRGVQLYRLLAGLWSGGDFADGQVSDVSTLRHAMELQAAVTAPAGDLPRIDLPGFEVFSTPARDRALWLNDGQPLRVTQTVVLRFAGTAPENLPPPLQSAAAGEKLGVAWERVDDHTARRTAVLELARSVVPAGDYAALRQAVRAWNAALTRPE